MSHTDEISDLPQIPQRFLVEASSWLWFSNGVVPTEEHVRVFATKLWQQARLAQQWENTKGELLKRVVELAKASTLDTLTGLNNRAGFASDFEHLLGSVKRDNAEYNHHIQIAVIYFDIDHFKRVNDTYGHGVGDEVIKGLARVANNHVRTGDIVGRRGGEEFAILMTCHTAEEAVKKANEIREAFAAVEFDDGKSGKFSKTASFGVAMLNMAEGESLEDALDRADTALYRAKKAGRNQVCFEKYDQSGMVIVSAASELTKANPWGAIDQSVINPVRRLGARTLWGLSHFVGRLAHKLDPR